MAYCFWVQFSCLLMINTIINFHYYYYQLVALLGIDRSNLRLNTMKYLVVRANVVFESIRIVFPVWCISYRWSSSCVYIILAVVWSLYIIAMNAMLDYICWTIEKQRLYCRYDVTLWSKSIFRNSLNKGENRKYC